MAVDVAAFLPCRAYGLGRPGSAAAMPSVPPSPRALLTPFSTAMYGRRNDEALDGAARLKSSRRRGNSESSSRDRMYSSEKKKIGFSTKQQKSGPMALLLLCAATVLLGTPNFGGIATPSYVTMSYKASALETKSNDESQRSSSTSTWPPSSSLSDQLLKLTTARDIAKDSASPQIVRRRYWDSMEGSAEEIMIANEKLIDHAVATVSTMYYDSSGGFNFDAREFYAKWKKFRHSTLHPREGVSKIKEKNNFNEFDLLTGNGFATRENAVRTLKSIVSQLNDPYSRYLTRDELGRELKGGDDGFLGLGALVDVAPPSSSTLAFDTKRSIGSASSSTSMTEFNRISNRPVQGGVSLDSMFLNQQFTIPISSGHDASVSGSPSTASSKILSVSQAANLPVITAIIPDSPAERVGLVVGDRIASVGDYQFTGMSRSQVERALAQKFHAENYFGRAELIIAKQVMATPPLALSNDNARYDADGNIIEEKYVFEDGWYRPKYNRIFNNRMLSEQVLDCYKLSHLKSIPTTLTAKLDSSAHPINTASPEMIQQSKFPSVVGGDSIVHFELLTPDDSIFQQMTKSGPVGYIRLTRFSKSSTAGYINAINSLEEAGAQSYIIDLRNNYGGVIQEAMLTASTLLRDPHSVLCYTLNSRGGFKPQENMEYIVDSKYPGYLLSSESRTVSRDLVRREHPEYLEDGGWTAPTSYASLKELRMTRGIKPAHIASSSSGALKGEGLERMASLDKKEINLEKLADVMTSSSQKKLVILINEGTASAAEVFASALHDNGRTVALVGTKTFGKGLIQHTFPMPDGGGLRLTVAEYLTPSLQHVTKVGGAKYDSGVKPDIRCEGTQGIPQNVGADLCVGVALDVLESKGG
mmetsp:Transcript_11146/g.24131  ORF Transcript_11146/g.24131 Transcript_11146/m.24131 type:complete len:872 (-) Transcript_11146:68-2683(-)